LYREIFSLLTKTRDGDEYSEDVRRKVEVRLVGIVSVTRA